MSVMYDDQAEHTTQDNGTKNWSDKGKEPTEQELSATLLHQIREGAHTVQRILLVEDDLTLATLEAEILAAHGYSVSTVQSGELAVTTLHRSIPDLVVLDLELVGDIQGWDVLQELRALAIIPVLITSSSATTARKYMQSSGETRLTLDHLPKPYPMQALLKRIRRMLTPS
ncbi:MAG: hypothetical protein NVSMB44_03150 [Ktedonobacteraceae bacterium]